MNTLSSQCITGPFMEAGAKRLLPMIERYRAELGHAILELGPNKHPLITPETHDGRIVYVEVSEPCIEFLKAKFNDAVTVTVVRFDLNHVFAGGRNRLQEAVAAGLKPEEAQFNALILSQILNYIDYRRVLEACAELGAADALLFVNNIMNHGVGSMLHEARPRSLGEFVEAATEFGFEPIETLSEPAGVADATKVRDLAVLRLRRSTQTMKFEVR